MQNWVEQLILKQVLIIPCWTFASAQGQTSTHSRYEKLQNRVELSVQSSANYVLGIESFMRIRTCMDDFH